MNSPEPNVISAEQLATSSTVPFKALTWPRNPRTSCDLCKQMKIKCQRKDGESCTRCITRNLQCTTTPVERKRRKLTDKRGEYFDEMEDRIKRMESAIITSRLPETTEPEEEGKGEEMSSSDKIESQAELSNHLSNLVIDVKGAPNFIGWASGFSLLSPQGLRWISEKVGDKDELSQLFRTISSHDFGAWGHADADLWYPRPRSQHSPIPSKGLALQYVNSFFKTFNNVFPVLNHKVFNSYFERQYSSKPPDGTAWYALFNSVLCLGSIRTTVERETHKRGSCLVDYTSIGQGTAIDYFRNASCCFHDLFFKEANLMAMQAVTLMLYITTSSPNPQPGYALASAAGNLANTLGLHRSFDAFSLAPDEIEQRRNVFWMFYLIEKAISHNLGRPSVINDDDIAVGLPPKNPALTQFPSRVKVYDIFQDQITLAIIGSRIYRELYSASSQTKSEVARMNVLGKLHNHLERWRDAVPVDIRPENPIKCSDEQYVPVVMMHFAYLDAVILLHRLSGHQESFRDGEATNMENHDKRPRLNPKVYASRLLCLAAARRTIRLLETLNGNNLPSQPLMWMALYYPLSASLVLFANILSNPQDRHVASDVELMNLITSFITHSIQPGTSFAATPTVSVFKELVSIATRLVARVPPKSIQKMKRLYETNDPKQSESTSSTRLRLVPERSLSPHLNTQPATSLSRHSQHDHQTPKDSMTTYSETDVPKASRSPLHSSQQTPEGNHDVQSFTSATPSHESIGDSPLEFAPFKFIEPSQFDYNPPVYDSLLSPTRSELEMANMWMPSFEPDLWASADLMGFPADANMEYTDGYFDDTDDGNNGYQQ